MVKSKYVSTHAIPEQLVKERVTGFDVLLRKKHEDLEKVRKLVLEDRSLTRNEIARRVGISVRTVSRHLVYLRSVYTKGVVRTGAEIQVEEKKKRLRKLRRLVYEHPEWEREKLASELGVSQRTLTLYFREL